MYCTHAEIFGLLYGCFSVVYIQNYVKKSIFGERLVKNCKHAYESLTLYFQIDFRPNTQMQFYVLKLEEL